MMPLIELPQDLYQKLLEKAKKLGTPIHDLLTKSIEEVEKLTPKDIIQRLMMTSESNQTMASYDPITLAILSKMLQGEDSSSKWAQMLMQMQQQQQQQFMQLLMLILTMIGSGKDKGDLLQAMAQIMGQNIQMSQQQMQSFMQMLQNQYQQTLQLQKEAMEKSEKKIKEELKDTLEEFSRTIEYLASALARPPETKSDIDKFLEQLEKFSKLKQKIDQIFYTTPELMEKYKTPEGKPDYGALILDMLGKNISQALEVLKYKYMTDAQRSQQSMIPQIPQAQITPTIQRVEQKPQPKPEPEKPQPQSQPSEGKKEEPVGRWISEKPIEIKPQQETKQDSSTRETKKQAPI